MCDAWGKTAKKMLSMLRHIWRPQSVRDECDFMADEKQVKKSQGLCKHLQRTASEVYRSIYTSETLAGQAKATSTKLAQGSNTSLFRQWSLAQGNSRAN